MTRFALAAMVAFVSGAGSLAAQSVLLQLKPRVGDTLRMRLEQTTRINASSSVARSDPGTGVVNTVLMFSRAVVEAGGGTATMILAITDSVLLSSTDERTKAAVGQAERRLTGQRARIRMEVDGSVGVVDGPGGSARGVSEAAAMIPATFPRDPVSVGESWVREMTVPGGATPFGASIGGRVRAAFRLDSLGRGGQLAYVSIQGDLMREDAARALGAARVDSGSVKGVMVVDRARGWLSDSWVVIVAQSTVMPLPGMGGMPMHFTMTLTQRMKVER